MKKVLIAGFSAGVVLLILSLALFFLQVKILPELANQYWSDMFRRSDPATDWLFYAHPFVLSFALKWFWERYKDIFEGSNVLKAFEVALVYGIVAMVPVLWLTYSSIDITLPMVLTWLVYGILQAFVAGLIFSWLNP
jgi:predicted neutral ceramidase superfamily lipid hydrolase